MSTKQHRAIPSESIVRGGLLRIDDAADFLCLSRASLKKLISSGAIASVRLGVRSRRIPIRALEAYAESRLVCRERV